MYGLRLCTFQLPGVSPGRERMGVVAGSNVFEAKSGDSLMAFLRAGGSVESIETSDVSYDSEEVIFMAPVSKPGKIIATIVNTQGMLGGKDLRLDWPRLDMKAPSSVIGPGEKIEAPGGGIRPEIELAAVMGKKLSAGSQAEAMSSIAGFTILNDVTSPQDSRDDAYEAYRRDRTTGEIRKSMLRGPLFRSKNHDTFCPMGPVIVTPDELDDVSDLKMTTKFNGELVQQGSSSEYIFSPAKIASYVSGFLTLEPGDVVSCGSVGWTPTALGELDPTEYVLPKSEGVLELEIEGIGKLTNPVSLSSN